MDVTKPKTEYSVWVSLRNFGRSSEAKDSKKKNKIRESETDGWTNRPTDGLTDKAVESAVARNLIIILKKVPHKKLLQQDVILVTLIH